jgi:predicted nucleic acid-binding protein
MSDLSVSATGFLVDSNVLIDIITRDSDWYHWSVSTLARAARTSAVSINPLIFAEVVPTFSRIDELDSLLPNSILRRAPLPYSAAFLAAKAFAKYRSKGGQKRSPLPDFYIGAHAVVHNLTLITRDDRRYRSYFPTLRLIAP